MEQMPFLNLCSGIDGFRLGLETVGHKYIGYCKYGNATVALYRVVK